MNNMTKRTLIQSHLFGEGDWSAVSFFFLSFLTTNFWDAVKVISVFGLHLVPEIAGFIIVAIGGGVLSRAILTEKFGSEGFKNVTRDALMLFLIACLLVIIAAFLEVYVTTGLFRAMWAATKLNKI